MKMKCITYLLLSVSFLVVEVSSQEVYSSLTWLNSYGTNLDERPVALQPLSSGNLLLVGQQITGATSDRQNIFLAIVDTTGILIDSTSLNFGVNESVIEVQAHYDNSFSLIGHKGSNIWTARLSDSFDIIYSSELPYSHSSENYGSLEIHDSLWVLTAPLDSSLCLIGLNLTGDIILEIAYPQSENAYEMWGVGIERVDNGYVIAANTSFWHGDYADYFPTLIYVDSNFVFQDSRLFQTEPTYAISRPLIDFTIDENGYSYLLYNSWTGGAGWDDSYITCVYPDGYASWTQDYGSIHAEIGNDICYLGSGEFLIVGSSRSFNPSYIYNQWAVKIDSEGNILWEYTGEDAIWGSFRESYKLDDGKYLVLHSLGQDNQLHLSALIEHPVSISEFSSTPENFEIKSIYPNPANPTSTIRIAINSPTALIFKIFDLSGREISMEKLPDIPPGEYLYSLKNVVAKESNLPSGVYILEVEGNGISQARKILILK